MEHFLPKQILEDESRGKQLEWGEKESEGTQQQIWRLESVKKIPLTEKHSDDQWCLESFRGAFSETALLENSRVSGHFLFEESRNVFSFFLFAVLGMEPRAFHMAGKHSTTYTLELQKCTFSELGSLVCTKRGSVSTPLISDFQEIHYWPGMCEEFFSNVSYLTDTSSSGMAAKSWAAPQKGFDNVFCYRLRNTQYRSESLKN